MNAQIKPVSASAPTSGDFKVADLSLAEWGRKELDIAEHDEILAAVSHLPHLLAFALVDYVAGRPGGERFMSFAAGGFRDFTRIASSHPEMWRDIFVANRDALMTELDGYGRALDGLRGMLERGDAAALHDLFEKARDARNRWLEKGGS